MSQSCDGGSAGLLAAAVSSGHVGGGPAAGLLYIHQPGPAFDQTLGGADPEAVRADLVCVHFDFFDGRFDDLADTDIREGVPGGDAGFAHALDERQIRGHGSQQVPIALEHLHGRFADKQDRPLAVLIGLAVRNRQPTGAVGFRMQIPDSKSHQFTYSQQPVASSGP